VREKNLHRLGGKLLSEASEAFQNYRYNTLKTGINLPVILQSGKPSLEINAKTRCNRTIVFFERKHGGATGH